jgi:hypothetical protein
VLPISADDGTYVNENGEELVCTGETLPAPFSVIVTEFAFPPIVFPFNVYGVAPHVDALLEERVTEGPLTQPHATVNELPVAVQPAAFLATITCCPFDTPENTVEAWKAPLSRLYSIPVPVGVVTVSTALPLPRLQFILATGAVDKAGEGLIVTSEDEADVQPDWLVTV